MNLLPSANSDSSLVTLFFFFFSKIMLTIFKTLAFLLDVFLLLVVLVFVFSERCDCSGA